jgi:hypothetical protein
MMAYRFATIDYEDCRPKKINRSPTHFPSAAQAAEWLDIGSLALESENIDEMVGWSAEMRIFGKNVRFISSRAMALLTAYDWPGNVREFSNMIQNAVLHTDSDRLDATALPEHVAHAATNAEVIAQQSASTARSSDAPAHASETEAESPLLLDVAIKKTLMQSLEEAEGGPPRGGQPARRFAFDDLLDA